MPTVTNCLIVRKYIEYAEIFRFLRGVLSYFIVVHLKYAFLFEVDTLWYTMSEKKNTQFFTYCSEKQYILKILWTNGELYFKKFPHSSF